MMEELDVGIVKSPTTTLDHLEVLLQEYFPDWEYRQFPDTYLLEVVNEGNHLLWINVYNGYYLQGQIGNYGVEHRTEFPFAMVDFIKLHKDEWV